jgi:hypothetical protein
MPNMNPTDKMRSRSVGNYIRLIREHLEAMQRDVHGLEYTPWKREVDNLWKRTFEQISRMSETPQQSALEVVREPWTTYITHYGMREID